jgi:hypothetical protein
LVVAQEDVENPWSLFQIQIKTENDELWWYEKDALRPAQPRLVSDLSSITCARNQGFPLHVYADHDAVSVSAAIYCHMAMPFLCMRSEYHSMTLRHNSLKEKFRREAERFEREMAQRELDEIQVQEIMVQYLWGWEGSILVD